MKTTNYYNTFIQVAEDCPVSIAEVPPRKSEVNTIANIQYEMLMDNPYKHTSDDVLFHIYAIKNNIARKDLVKTREQFFTKGQPCFRSSPLTKRYGWGVHCNAEGRIAIYAVESKDYTKLVKNKALKQLKAMRSKRS